MFKSLDFVYIPAPDIESSVVYYKNTLGGELLCIVLSEEEPYILLANHLEKNDIVLIYNVSNLEKTVANFAQRDGKRKEIRNSTWSMLHFP